MSKPKVVLIAGSGHGGTTILNMMLGQHPEIFATGKLRDFPHGGLFIEGNVCSCGEPASSCPFWTQVRESFAPYQERGDQERIPRLAGIISELSGRPFVGDVSHNVGYARQLAGIGGIDLYLVHVIRDGRGVVHSRVRKDYRIGRLKSSRLAHLRRVVTVSRRWAWHRRRFAALERQLGARAVHVHYEELCRDPQGALEPVGDCLRLDFGAIGERLAAGQPFRRMPHLIRGNEVLRSRDDVVLRQDTAWRSAMSLTDRAVFRLATLLP